MSASAPAKQNAPTRRELKTLARLRLREAYALFDAGLYDGAAYLCGYVVELALKARICRLMDLATYPESGKLQSALRTHNLEDLLMLGGLRPALKRASGRTPGLQMNWEVLLAWTPETRYQPQGTHSRQTALKWLGAVNHPTDGVFAWIARRW